MSGILAYGTYLPMHLLSRKAIGEALGTSAGKGTRAVASFDEDTTTMGVEAARTAMRAVPGAPTGALTFSTTRPAYSDKTNATAIHVALGLADDVPAYDMVGAVRSGIAAVRSALRGVEPTLAVLADIRTGLPAGVEEHAGGDGAAALLCAAEGDFIADYVGGSSTTAEFLDRWRMPGDFASKQWEERFGEHVYVPLADSAFAAACKNAGVTPDDIDHAVVTGLHSRAVARVRSGLGVRADAVVDDLGGVIGNTGTAHPGLLLGSVLDRAKPGELIALVILADGCDVLFFRTTDLLAERRQTPTVQDQIASMRGGLPYAKFQSWRGLYRLEPPRRPDFSAPTAPPAFRYEDWKFAFTGSTCTQCGTRHLPPQVVCMSCQAVDSMKPERFADLQASIATFTIDRLANSESPPVLVGVLDFDGGGRYQCELTDAPAEQITVGGRVEMTFRKIFTAAGIHNYFWKARPIRGES